MESEPEINLPGAIVVAHPDDETLWAGGYVLSHPELNWVIVTLCRGSDPDRAPKFYRVLEKYQATGDMGDLDDSPEQAALPAETVSDTILKILPDRKFALIITHHPLGEYTRHRRHEETSQQVSRLWVEGKIHAEKLWMFAYEDKQRQILPRVQPGADLVRSLPDLIWKEKYTIMTNIYGFSPDSWEARTTPRMEGFWCFDDPLSLQSWAATRRFSE